jgi:hypothetical protein
MRLTKVLGMDEYFRNFPDKRPDPRGSVEQQYGDNMYFREDGRWLRVPSAEHNSVESFQQDRGRRVYLAEGADCFSYFGAANPIPDIQGLADRFPWLIQDRQGFKYVRDAGRIQAFADWLSSLERKGLVGKPRDQKLIAAYRYLTAIDPIHVWCDAESGTDLGQMAVSRCTRGSGRPVSAKRGC